MVATRSLLCYGEAFSAPPCVALPTVRFRGILFLTAIKLSFLALGCPAFLSFARAAAAEEVGFLERGHKDADGNEAHYELFVPHDYKADKPFPLIRFLHGSGETGTDGKKQTTVGLGPAIRE